MLKRHVLLAAATMLVATACVKVNLDIEVADDGSAELRGIVALDADRMVEFAESFGEDLGGDAGGEASFATREELCNEFLDENELGTDQETPELETRPYDEDGFCGVEFSGSLTPEQVEQQMGDLSGGESGTLRRDGDGWYFELPLGGDALGTEDLDDAGGLIDIDDLLGGAEYVVRVKLPGTQVEHNADAIEGDGTMVWDIDFANPPERLFVRTEAGDPITGSGGGGDDDGGGNALVTVLIVLVVLALLGLGAWYLVSRRKPKDAAPDIDPAMQSPLGSSTSAPPMATSDAGDAPPPPSGSWPSAPPAEGAAPTAPAPGAWAGAPTTEDLGPATSSTGWSAPGTPGGDPTTPGFPVGDHTAPASEPEHQGQPDTAWTAPEPETAWTPPEPERQEQPAPQPEPPSETAWTPPEPETAWTPSAPETAWTAPAPGPEPHAQPAPQPEQQPSEAEWAAQPEPQPDASAPAPQPAPEPEPAPGEPVVIASPTPEQATGAPVWDSSRDQYVQWDPNAQRWLDFDNDTQTWAPRA